MDWQECKEKRFVKEAKINNNLITSLIKMSEKKLESANRLALDETTASSKASLLYDSLREILEALAIKKGFKVYNHECFCSFLKEICGEAGFSRTFNKFRIVRNQINYYAEDLTIAEAGVLIKEITKLRKDIFGKYFKEK